ncbi:MULTISPECIES: MaoC family dehydratase [Rhodococcus]|uniref:Putative enoyl-CoA hydratase n=1 Tax=Rhodococcus wratislaviensis NBRC 100605 TaxID=1219028 RepID=X0Q9R6_RHOWR|nr:MaoC family dehydratase [Rhodococcus wratislaviensis]GAF48337.1 putative enoyl-CoA hydratase [Rhodococcus wratislaviensis NBRC 100605]
MTHFAGLDALRASVDADLGTSRWIDIDQARIDSFADTTEDRQWIHTDPKAAAQGPFGTTIAHGFMTLSLVAAFLEDLMVVDGIGMAVNYGLNKVRFPAPVPVGSRVRARGRVLTVDEIPGGLQTTVLITIERDGSDKPVCVAESVSRFLAPVADTVPEHL